MGNVPAPPAIQRPNFPKISDDGEEDTQEPEPPMPIWIPLQCETEAAENAIVKPVLPDISSLKSPEPDVNEPSLQ